MNTWRKDWRDKGFTMAELLIVVAIIAVLAAIAIPIFTSQLEKSREGTDADAIRNEYAKAALVILDGSTANTDDYRDKGTIQGRDYVIMGPIDINQQEEMWQYGDYDIAGVTITTGHPAPVNTKNGGKAYVMYTFDDNTLYSITLLTEASTDKIYTADNTQIANGQCVYIRQTT